MSAWFRQIFPNFPQKDKLKIAQFIRHVEQNGLTNLTDRNKSSADVHKDDPDFLNKVTKAREYNLWHYHIGIPYYETATNGDMVSEYILHYIKGDDFIKIVDLDSHPPFILPSNDYLH